MSEIYTPQQIDEIFCQNGFAHDHPTLTNVGFRNQVYIGEHAVLKVYGDDNKSGYQKERWFYETANLDCIPKLYACGDNWILIERIHGVGLFRHWRSISDAEREAIVKQIAAAALAVSDLDLSGTAEFLPYSDDYQKSVLEKIDHLTQQVRSVNGIDETLLSCAVAYVHKYAYVLDDTQLYPVHTDLHFDNFLVKDDGSIVLIDFEMLEAAPKDMVLDVWQRMLLHPFTYANEEDDPHTHAEDYQSLMIWIQKYAPELFSHPQVRRRVNLYAICYELDCLCEYPRAQKPTERLERYLKEVLW